MKKIISITLAVTTVMWLSGVAMLAPVSAITIVEGDIVSPDAEYTDADGNAYYPYDVFIIKYVGAKKFKRLVLNPQVFDSYGHLEWTNIKTATVAELQAFTTSEIIRADGDDKVYKLFPDGDTGTKRWVETLDCFTTNSYDWDSVYIINTTDRDNYTTGAGMCGGDGGEISLSLASDTPLAGDLPYNAESIPFIKVNVTGSGTISQMVFKRSGAGEAADFDNVYLYEGDVRLTSGRSVSGSTDKVTFIGLSVTAPTTLSVVADLAGSSTDYTHRNTFGLVSASDVTANGTVGGTFPIAGNLLTITNIQGARLAAAKAGSIANPNVGSIQAEVCQFKLTSSYENIDVERITLYNAGSMNSSEITNLEMKVLGETVATTAAFGSGDLVTFGFDTPYRLGKGESKVFRVYGDLSGEPTETIQIYYEVSADVRGTGASYGQGAEIDITSFDGTDTSEYHALVLQGGEVTLSFNNPIATDIGDDTNDTVMLDFTIAAISNIEVRRLRFYIGNDGNGATMANLKTEIEDIKLKDVDSGLVLMGPTDGTSGTSVETAVQFSSTTYDGGELYVEWTTAFDIDAGESKHLQLTLDIAASAYITAGTDAFAGMLYSLSSTTNPIKYRDTNDYVAAADMVPNTSQEGNAMTIQSTSIAVALGALPTADVDVVKGQQGVTAQSLIFTAGKSSDMELTDLSLKAYVSDTGTGYNTSDNYGPGVDDDTGSEVYAKNVVTKVYLYEDDGTTLIGGPEGFSGTNSRDVVFSSLSWVIEADASKKMLIVVDISTEATSGTYDFVYFDIDDAAAGNSNTDVTVVDDEGTTRNPSSTNLVTEDAPGLAIRKSDGGTLTAAVTAAGIKPNATYVYQGQATAPFSKFKFTSTLEAFIIDKLTIECDGGTGDAINMAGVTIEYPTDAAGTLATTDGDFGSTASITFSGLDFYVPKDDYAYVTVYADLADYSVVDDQSADSWSLDFEGDGTTTFHATGVGSSKVIDAATSTVADADGNDMYLYRTFPSFTFDGPTGTTGPTMATRILEFTVTNNGDYDLVFNSTSGLIQFDVIGSGDVGTDAIFTLYKEDGTTVDATAGTGVDANAGGGSASASFNFGSTTITIPELGSQSFYVEITSLKSTWNENGDYLQLKLQNFADTIKWVDGGDTTQVGYTADILDIGIPLIGGEFSVSGL